MTRTDRLMQQEDLKCHRSLFTPAVSDPPRNDSLLLRRISRSCNVILLLACMVVKRSGTILVCERNVVLLRDPDLIRPCKDSGGSFSEVKGAMFSPGFVSVTHRAEKLSSSPFLSSWILFSPGPQGAGSSQPPTERMKLKSQSVGEMFWRICWLSVCIILHVSRETEAFVLAFSFNFPHDEEVGFLQ